MTVPVIPLKLQELVIDSVHDRRYWTTKATLCICSLTCRAWLPRSRRRLYEALDLGKFSQRQLDKLLALIESSPDVSNAVQKLHHAQFTVSRDGPIDSVIIRFAHKLPALRSLTINSDMTITSLSLEAALSTFPTLTSLTLGCVYVTHMLAFRKILAALPALRKLSLEDVKWWHHHGNDGFSSYPSDVYPIPPLTHLAWSRTEFWMDSIAHAAKSAAVFTCLLRAVCQSIEYVSVEDLQGEIIEQVASHMSGSLVLPRLSTIKLLQDVDDPDDIDGQDYPTPRDDLTDVLRRQKSFLDTILPADHLRSVTIAFKYTHSASPALSGSLNALLRGFEEISTDLEDSLTTPSLERLEAVEFQLQEVRPPPKPSVESLHRLVMSLLSSMEATFPRLRARGLLDVKFMMVGGGVPTHYRVDRGVLQATPIPEHDLHPFQ